MLKKENSFNHIFLSRYRKLINLRLIFIDNYGLNGDNIGNVFKCFSGLNRDNVVIFFLFFSYKPIGLVLSYLMMHCLAQVAEEEKNVSVT